MQINHHAKPFYAQIYEYLRHGIQQGTWLQGELLPSEAELCAQFNVSRTVVRRALQDLEYGGLIYKRQGKGSFVAERKLQELLLQRLTGFYQDMVNQGHKITNSVLRQEVVKAEPEVSDALGLKEGEEVILLERLRFVDGMPVNVSISYVPRKQCPSLLLADMREGSLYHFLEVARSQRIVRGRRTIEAVRPTAHLTRLLEIEADLPLFKITNICSLADGTLIEYSKGYHRSDRTLFQVELLRTDAHEFESDTEKQLPQSHTLTE